MIVTSLDKVISPELLIEVWMQTRFIALAVGIGVFLAVLEYLGCDRNSQSDLHYESA